MPGDSLGPLRAREQFGPQAGERAVQAFGGGGVVEDQEARAERPGLVEQPFGVSAGRELRRGDARLDERRDVIEDFGSQAAGDAHAADILIGLDRD